MATDSAEVLDAGTPGLERLIQRCQAKLHGPYLTWTRSVGGKTITRALTPDQADRARAWFDNAQRLRELTDELKRLGIEHAQTDEHWPAT